MIHRRHFGTYQITATYDLYSIYVFFFLLLLIFKWSCGALYCQKGGTCYSRGAPVAEGTECGFRKVKY